MKTIEYFKLQAKNLHKDFKTQKPYFDPLLGKTLYGYEPKFFDVEALLNDFDINEDQFTLMNAQHIIAKVVGFDKWTDMVKASPPALELAKLLFDNLHKIRNEEWEYYLLDIENENDVILDDEDKLDIFKTVYADVDGHQSCGYDYRLAKSEKPSSEKPSIKLRRKKATVQITALPLVGKNRMEFIRIANSAFENVLQKIEPEHPHLVRNSWDAEKYIDEILKPDMLPIDRDYALSLIESFSVTHVIGLAVEADNQAVHLIRKN